MRPNHFDYKFKKNFLSFTKIDFNLMRLSTLLCGVCVLSVWKNRFYNLF